MEFDIFKQKINNAGCKVGLLSKSSYLGISKMIPDDETILFACETLPVKLSGLYGVVVITENNFYGYIPQADKTFLSISIVRSEINDIESSGGISKIATIKTANAEYCIGKTVDNWPKLSRLIKTGEILPNTTPSLKEIFTDISATKEPVEKTLRCPKCGSENIEPLAITSGKTKGFGLGKAAVGGLALGPLGLAAGVIGMGKGKTKTDIEWVCKSCAKQFKKPKND